MKIQLQFEPPDLSEMITQYFEARGFRVKNLEEICSKFDVAFPQGLVVDAEVAPVSPVAATIPAPPPPSLTITTGGEPSPTGYRLKTADLFDPEFRGVPSRDDLLKQEAEEMQRILEKSRSLAEKKNV